MTTSQQTPIQSPNPGIVFELMIGPIRMAVLDTALKLGMADILAQKQDLQSIARALEVKTDTANLAHFLDAMASMGFADKRDERYFNTPFAESCLRKESPSYLGDLVSNLSHMQHRNLDRIPELIRQGPPEVSKQDQLHEEERWKQSVRHLASYHKAGMADLVAELVAALPEFPSMKRMLDLGCGPGIMCMTTVSRHPSLEGVLCDFPSVMEVAREEIAAAGMESRISTIEGDYNKVDFGKGYDLVWASHTLYYAKDLDAMFARIHEALNPGGVLITFHEGLTHERTQPTELILSRLSLALEGQDVSFEQGQIASHLPKAGFASVDTRTITLPMGPMELVVARKQG
ncbi:MULTISPECIES: class I SAM-dependent methyltransferase [unclassified Pseudodesulfovibrio]|uniref:class I SAM-dependent methyltransferase n=1 Tax=unclassified Pseudodesulfovibrio TaxID=2661612 RepID=UPI000FEB9DA2|nr:MULTISPECIES: class I SAM-dependent methyltransferase [unclassified Pseudodesulfovibrio]MCJ2163379.1 methyltransferase domain-containing protein [Pseudodesulfovibrio sp. S3-i]RWU06617.1 methyltransferase domain-containing protein [Pseudodesulfovibrio sp. S3]